LPGSSSRKGGEEVTVVKQTNPGSPAINGNSMKVLIIAKASVKKQSRMTVEKLYQVTGAAH